MNNFTISHPDKILYPRYGITKQQVAKFYQNISNYILPYLRNRPLVIVRCPEGQDKECFYQKHFTSNSDFLHIVNIKEKTAKEPYVYVNDTLGLIELVQLNSLELHCWGCHVDNVEKPDLIVFDLDPAPDIPWNNVIKAAFLIKEELENIGLKSFVKTSGNKGLHIVLPFLASLSWKDVKIFSSTFAQFIENKDPSSYIINMNKVKRKGKIFIDYLRNNRGSTTVSAYSLRTNEHATVSTPLSWSELTPRVHSSSYTLFNIFRRLARLKKDPWEEFYTLRQSLPYFNS